MPHEPPAFHDPAAFYTGLVAELYAPLRSSTPDPEPYARFVARWGEPALELACGDGDPLLDLRARGLDVEGLDSSPDMVSRCREAAARRGLTVTVHLQRMEEMALRRRYRSIFLAGASFNLLPDDATAEQALVGIAAHLAPGGAAMVPLMVPAPTPASELGVGRHHLGADGTTLSVTALSEVVDVGARTRTTTLRYERRRLDRPEAADAEADEVAERPWVLHWHEPEAFVAMAARCGLSAALARLPDHAPGGPSDVVWVAVLRPS